MKKESLSYDTVYTYQESDLLNWKKILNPSTFETLCKIVRSKNKKTKSPNDICRGSEITNIVVNLGLGNEELYLNDLVNTFTIDLRVTLKTKGEDIEKIKSSLSSGIFRGLDSSSISAPTDVNIQFKSIFP